MQVNVVEMGPFVVRFDESRVWFIFAADATSRVTAQQGVGASDLARMLARQEARLQGRVLSVDLQNAPILDSLQIGLLLALAKAAKSYGRIELTNVSDGVTRLLRATGVERQFDVAGAEVFW